MPHSQRRLSASLLNCLGVAERSFLKYSPLASSRRLSSSNAAHDPDAEREEGHNVNEIITAEISNGGTHITLNQANSSQSIYHASWLWSNDPKRVTLPSGQRTCTPGHWRSFYGKPKIKYANIVYCDTSSESKTLNQSKLQVPGPTPNDCCHPLSIYGYHPPWVKAIPYTNNTTDKNLRPYLQIDWAVPDDNVTDKSSVFDVEWLRRFRYDDRARMMRRKKNEIQPIHAIRKSGPPLRYSLDNSNSLDGENIISEHEQDGLVHVNYHSIIDKNGHILESGLLNLMDAIFKDGAAIVSETPQPHNLESSVENNFPVASIAKAMSGGSLSHGALYDNIFHVREGEANSKNVAYTSIALCPHQDLAYYESPPGIQLLHCVAMGNGVVGGESTLIDAMAAAYRLRELRPDSFEYLVKCPATFVKQRDRACMTYSRPHIVLAEEGYSRDMTISSFDREIIAVHWSPPFEGPVLLPPNDVDNYYDAYADFEQMIDNSLTSISGGSEDLRQYANEYTWEQKLSSGDMLVFNNRRMLHGRRGFSVKKGDATEESRRHLVGCYINIDDTLNHYRVLLRDANNKATNRIMNVCNGSIIIP